MSNVWKVAGVPVKKDKAIIDNVIAVKTKYQKILKNKHKLRDAEKQEYIDSINTTFNITVHNWRELIEEDTTLTNPQKGEKIKIILDYIGDSATRYCTK